MREDEDLISKIRAVIRVSMVDCCRKGDTVGVIYLLSFVCIVFTGRLGDYVDAISEYRRGIVRLDSQREAAEEAGEEAPAAAEEVEAEPLDGDYRVLEDEREEWHVLESQVERRCLS